MLNVLHLTTVYCTSRLYATILYGVLHIELPFEHGALFADASFTSWFVVCDSLTAAFRMIADHLNVTVPGTTVFMTREQGLCRSCF